MKERKRKFDLFLQTQTALLEPIVIFRIYLSGKRGESNIRLSTMVRCITLVSFMNKKGKYSGSTLSTI